MKRVSLKVLGVIVIIIMIGLQTSLSYAVSQKDIDSIDNQIEEKKEELNNIQNEKSETMKQVEELTSKINDYQAQIDEMDGKIADLNNKIQESEEKINKAQEDYNKQEELLEARLVANYEAGETSFLDVLLSSDSITDLISNYYLVTEIATNDAELLDKIQKEKEEIEKAKQDLENSKKELDTSKAEKQGVATQLQNSKAEKDSYVAQLSENEKQTQNEIEEFEADKAAIRKQIQEQAKKYSSQKPSGGSSAKPSSPSASGFIRPVSGYSITCGWYGYSGHTGADYSGSGIYGKPVLAAKAGVVYVSTTLTGSIPNYGSDGNYVGSYRSYGEYIIIDHQDGTMTLYAHGKPGSRLVSPGQHVSQGQQIMSVGNTGNVSPRPSQSNPLNGSHLHVEVWVNGIPVNPANYLP